MKYYVPYALHRYTKGPNGAIATVIDGDRHVRDESSRPAFDTHFAICNPTSAEVDILFRFFNIDGSVALWRDGSTENVYRLSSRSSLSTTLIPGRVFPDPPQNFVGYAELETQRTSPFSASRLDLPLYVMVGGGGFFPDQRDTFFVSVPIYTDESTRPDFLRLRSSWSFAYATPFFDKDHFDMRSCRTGVVITNFGKAAAWLHFRYTISDRYPDAVQEYSFQLPLGGRHCFVENLYQLLRSCGYPENQNTEGWLSITARASADPLSREVHRPIVAWLLHSNEDFSMFGAGHSFWP